MVFAVAVMAITLVPYVLGYLVEGDEWRFTGFVLSVDDGNAFIGKMLSGKVGEWLFRTPYTAVPQRGFAIFLPYLLLGKLASSTGTHEQLVALYHVFRFGAGVLAILATYDFLSCFIERVAYRRWGTVLVALGGGLGWLLSLLNRQAWLGSLPLEFYSPESFGFLSLYVYPHYALARAGLLWGLVAYLRGVDRLNKPGSIPAQGLGIGLVWLLTGLAQPLTGMVVGAVVGIHVLTLTMWQTWLSVRHEPTHWPRLGRLVMLAAWAGLVAAPFVAYNLVAPQVDPFLKAWTQQSYFGSPHPLHYILAYGLILPVAVVGGWRLWQRGDWAAKLPVAWCLALPVLAYAPIGIQRRLPEGIWAAFVILGIKALEQLPALQQRRWGAILCLTGLSTLMLVMGGMLYAAYPAEPLFRPAQEVAAFNSLAGQTRRSAVVLSAYETGNALPAWAPVFVVIGHGPETVGFTDLLTRVQAFYQAGMPDSTRRSFLQEFRVNYVFWGPHERALGGWNPGTADFLTPVYQAGDYMIFAVNP